MKFKIDQGFNLTRELVAQMLRAPGPGECQSSSWSSSPKNKRGDLK